MHTLFLDIEVFEAVFLLRCSLLNVRSVLGLTQPRNMWHRGLMSHEKWNVMWNRRDYSLTFAFHSVFHSDVFCFFSRLFYVSLSIFLVCVSYAHCYDYISFDIWKEYKVLNYVNEVFTFQCLSLFELITSQYTFYNVHGNTTI